MSKIKKFLRPFRMGDMVKLVVAGEDDDELGEIHIIHEVLMLGPQDWEYSTNLGAWWQHAQFELVRECDAESLAELWASIEDQGEEEDEEEEDEDEESDAERRDREKKQRACSHNMQPIHSSMSDSLTGMRCTKCGYTEWI